MDGQAFQAQRRDDLLASDERLGPIVEAALLDRDNPDWYAPIVEEAGRIWVEFHQAEAPGANFQAALTRFKDALGDSLAKTAEDTVPGRVVRWTTTYTVNDGTITGAYARGIRHKIWRTMEDAAVRDVHREVDGQVRQIGGLFDLGGVRMPYPGAPVGNPHYWIECRCVAQPASADGEAMSTSTFALDPDDAVEAQDPATYSGALIVLLPAADDPVVAASSEPAHITTVWFGDYAEMESRDTPEFPQIDLDTLVQEVRQYAAELSGPVVVPVKERGTLGDEDADVVFLEPTESLIALRDGLLQEEQIRSAYEAVEQYPEWTPHVTLGYPETPARGEYDADAVTFDRVGLWLAGEQMEFRMGEAIATDEMPVDELEDGEEEITEIPVHGVATIEGKATGDGREFARGALTHRNLPLPLRLETVGTHGGDTSHVVPVGRIDEMWRQEGDEYNEYRYRGVIITTKDHAADAIDGIVDGSLTGVSVETDMTVRDPAHGEAQNAAMQKLIDGEELSSEEQDVLTKDVYSESRVCGFTIVPIPAFQEAYIGLGLQFADELDEECLDCAKQAAEAEEIGTYKIVDLTDLTEEEVAAYDAMSPEEQDEFQESRSLVIVASAFAPGTKDGPGWITHPIPTGRLRRYWLKGAGAAKIAWGTPGDFRRCRSQLRKYIANPKWLNGACANLHYEANGYWPGDRRNLSALTASGAKPAPLFSLTAAAIVPKPAEFFQRQELEDPREGVVVEGDHVFGYVAQWGVCHIGIEGVCTTAPHSVTNYAYYATGALPLDNGESVRVGQITIDTGHAGLRASAKVAAAHYDNTGAVVADVTVGEDEFGIWFSGMIRPTASEAQVTALAASGRVSGDWRYMPGYVEPEMIAALCVNVPGFPIPAKPGFAYEDGHQMSLVAAGIVLPEDVAEVREDEPEVDENVEYVASMVESVLLRLDERDRERQVRSRMETMRLADVRRRLERI